VTLSVAGAESRRSKLDLGGSRTLSSLTRAVAPLHRRILLVAVVTALATVFSLIAPMGAQAATSVATYAQMMQRVVDDTNAVRAEAGLRPLVRNADMDRVAAAWARQQWENGTMSHNPNYSTQIPSGWSRAGENVAKGYTYLQVVPAWKASPGHYANMVNDYNSIGIGYFEQDGRRYWTQLFAKYSGVTQPPIAAPIPTQIPLPAVSLNTSPRLSTPNLSLLPAIEPLPPLGIPLALSSPSFESGIGTWVAAGGVIDGPNTYARGGFRSLLVPGTAGRTVTQTVTTSVAAGSTTALTVWVRADGSATGTVRLRTVGGTTAESAEVNFTASSSGWLRVSVSLAAKYAHTGFRLEIVTPITGRVYRLDSVSLVRTSSILTSAPAVAAPLTAATSTTPLVISLAVPRTATTG
jgi:uncharacterized protein YkwD